MNQQLISRFYWLSIILLVLGMSLSGCNFPTSSSGTNAPTLTIQNATAGRDVQGLPVITLDYTVKYPSDLYAQTLPGVPALICTMRQTQLTRERSFTGAPVNVTGTAAAPQSGQVTINVPEDGKSIGGDFSIDCVLTSDRTLATSNRISVDVPKSLDALDPAAQAYVDGFAGTWDTNWGEMRCTVSGGTVNCDYTHDEGKISATLSADGKTLEGQWSEAPSYTPPQDGGRVSLTLSEDGNSLSGDWAHGPTGSNGTWTGTRK